MNRNAIILFLLVSAVLASCRNDKKKQAPANVGSPADRRDFPAVQVPAMISQPQERLDYAAQHFWDGFTEISASYACDSVTVAGVDKNTVEEQMGIYASLLGNIPIETARKSISSLFDRIEACERKDTASNVFEVMSSLAAKYFYDPNSPLRDEDIYLPFVKKLSASGFVKEEMRAAYGFDASMCALNGVGSRAANFAFTDINGRTRTLHSVKAPFTLLFFSNPGCPSCKEITEAFIGNGKVYDMIKGGTLAVVNIYIDLELDKWRESAATYPKEWYTGYDHNYIIRTDRIYNVRAIPSLYLLDGDKTVIMKDAPQEKILAFLNNLDEPFQNGF